MSRKDDVYKLSFLFLIFLLFVATAESAEQWNLGLPNVFSAVNITAMNLTYPNLNSVLSGGLNAYYNGLNILSAVDGYGCQSTYCIYHPWYAPTQTYAKNGTTGAVDVSGTNTSMVIQTTLNKNPYSVTLKEGNYDIGNNTITVPTHVSVSGEGVDNRNIAERPAGSPWAGTAIIYNGTSTAFKLYHVKDLVISNMLIDSASGSTAIYMNGAWLTTIRNVRIINATYSIKVDTDNAIWGAEHNVFEKIESPDSDIMFSTTGNDYVTTTTLNTIRGQQYIFQNTASFDAIQITAQRYAGSGTAITLNNTNDMYISSDIEGNFTTGVLYTNTNNKAFVKVSTYGFTGTTCVSGAPVTGYILGCNMQKIYGQIESPLFVAGSGIYNTNSNATIYLGAATPATVDSGKIWRYFFNTSGDATGQVINLYGVDTNGVNTKYFSVDGTGKMIFPNLISAAGAICGEANGTLSKRTPCT